LIKFIIRRSPVDKFSLFEVSSDINKSSDTISSELLTAFKAVVDAGGLEPLFNLLRPQMAEIETIVRAMAGNLDAAFADIDFTPLVAAFQSLGTEVEDALNRIFGDIDLSTAEGLTTALQKIINLFGTMLEATAGIIDQYDPIFDALGKAVTELGNAEGSAARTAGEFLGSAKILADYGLLLGGVVLLMKNSGTDIESSFKIFVGSVKLLVNGLQVGFDFVVLGLAGLLATYKSAMADITGGEVSRRFQAEADSWARIAEGARVALVSNLEDFSEGAAQVGEGFSTLGGTIEESSGYVTDFGKNVLSGLEGVPDAVGKFGDSAREAAGKADDLNTKGISLKATYAQMGIDAESGAKAIATLGQSLDGATEAVTGTVVETDKLIEKFKLADNEYGDLFSGYGGYKKVAGEAEDATEKSDTFLTKMEEIASNERIKKFEATMELDIANVEANAAIATATIETLGTSIQSTAALVGDLFSTFAGTESAWKSSAIEDQIRIENKRRDDELEQLKGLTKAQVDHLNARTKALQKGLAPIVIKGDGLAPELEAFMFEVLKRVQVEMSAQEASYLIGASA